MTEYKLELLIPAPMGISREVKLEGVIGDAQLAHATYHLLKSNLSNFLSGEVEHILTVYRNNKEITKEELSEDFRKYCGLDKK